MLAVVEELIEREQALLAARALVVKVEVQALLHPDKQTLVAAAVVVVAAHLGRALQEVLESLYSLTGLTSR
jgi:hypothetical protein